MIKNKSFNKVTGHNGEDIACQYLKKNGYKIIEKNFTTKLGEIDIVASHKGTIVFVEVKTRTSDYFGLPREAVTEYKQRKIRMVATQYLKCKGLLENACRFDVIEIMPGEINHIINCF